MDEDDEDMLLKCIEEKTTAHGRRGDKVMYSAHRVKTRNFVKLVNYNHAMRGFPFIKSPTTVFNRSKSHNKRSRQSKLQIGKGLFCTRKAPKCEEKENDLSHYQRGHKKHIISYFYGNEDTRRFVFEVSMDDKAYLCPGTSTGMTGARNIRYYQPADCTKARVLPKYDFPGTMVCVTPAGYRVMSKSIKNVGDKFVIDIVEDNCYV